MSANIRTKLACWRKFALGMKAERDHYKEALEMLLGIARDDNDYATERYICAILEDREDDDC